MSATPLYNEFPSFLKRYFPYKVQKISLNAGFTCPNRDGSKGYGGCTYCNNQTFNPDYCLRNQKTLKSQRFRGFFFALLQFAFLFPEEPCPIFSSNIIPHTKYLLCRSILIFQPARY